MKMKANILVTTGLALKVRGDSAMQNDPVVNAA